MSISGSLIYMLKYHVSAAISELLNVLSSMYLSFVLKCILKYTFLDYISGKINYVLSVYLSGVTNMYAEIACFSMAFSSF